MEDKCKLARMICIAIILMLTTGGIAVSTEISKYVSSEAMWKNKKEVKLEHIFTIGDDDFEENEDYFFVLIVDLKCDQEGNLYVLDLKTRRLNKYSPKGIFLKSFELRRGAGPGEFKMPRGIAIDKKGNIYIADSYNMVTVLDQSGKVKNIFRTKIHSKFASIDLDSDSNLYITRFRDSTANLVHKINPQNGEVIKSFCETGSEGNIRRSICGHLTLDENDNLYCSVTYPYEIKKFSKNGKLLKYFSRKADFQEPIKNEMVTSRIQLMSVCMGIAAFPDGKIVNLIRHTRKKSNGKSESEYWFDIFSKDGKWLISIAGTMLKNDRIRYFTIDPFGNLYLDYMHPNPHIKKFKIDFVDKK